MNRREDPLLRQHRTRLLQLAEATNIKPGRGSSKRRNQRSSQSSGLSNSGSGSTGGGRITLQDIVRNDPGYTSNIEHLVFPERKSSNPNLTSQSSSGGQQTNKSKPGISVLSLVNTSLGNPSARSRLTEVFGRHYARGSSLQDVGVTTRSNHHNSTSLDGEGGGVGATGHQPAASGGSGSGIQRNATRRWLSQTSQSTGSRQHSAESDGGNSHVLGSSGPVGVVNAGGPVSTSSTTQPAPRRVSPASEPTEITGSNIVAPGSSSSRSERGSNVSILHLRGAASVDTWESSLGQQQQTLNFGSIGRGNSYSCASSVSSLKRHEQTSATGTIAASIGSSSSILPKQQQQQHHRSSQQQQHQESSSNHSSQSSRRREATNSFLSGSGGTSGELFVSGNCSRELSPVRWCDREVDGVYLGRSGWVQVQQRSLDENRKCNYESSPVTMSRGGVEGSGGSSIAGISGMLTSTGTVPMPRRATVKLADYHCSNSEPGNCPDFTRALTLDSHRPDFLKLHHPPVDYETGSTCTSPHSIPESCSPPSITPIISPPPAFQDVARRSSRSSRSATTSYGKAPFLPRSNAIIDSDVISPPPSPPHKPPGAWSSLPSSSARKSSLTGQLKNRGRSRQQQLPTVINSQSSSTNVAVVSSQQCARQLERPYRLVPARSLEDQTSSVRRSQFAQRYRESSSSSSSSMGFRSLDSCVNRTTMPRLAENTDSSVEGYEDGDEDDNPSSSLNMSIPAAKSGHASSPDLTVISNTGLLQNMEKISPSGRHQSRHSRANQQLSSRRSPGSNEAAKQLSHESSSSCSSNCSTDRQGRSPTPNLFRRSNQNRPHQSSSRNTLVSPDSLQAAARVRRSRSLQLPEKRSPGSSGQSQQVSREHSRESSDSQSRVVVKIHNDRTTLTDRGKRHPFANRKAQSTEDKINAEALHEVEVVTEYLYGTRSRPTTRSLLAGRYESREEVGQQRRGIASNTGSGGGGGGAGTYDVYFISAKQPRQQHQPVGNNSCVSVTNSGQKQQQSNRRGKTLQRGATTPNPSVASKCPDFCLSSDSKNRCSSSTCDFWPHCSQRDNRYSSNQGQAAFMKVSQSYPSHRRLSTDNTGNPVTRDSRGSACSSPASLDVVDDRVDSMARKHHRQRPNSGTSSGIQAQTKDEERLPKSALKQSRKSPLESPNANDSFDKRDHHPTHWEYRKVSPIQIRDSGVRRSPSGPNANILSPSMTTSSSSSSDIWITTSDRTITKSPKNPKSSSASTPMEDAMAGSLKTLTESNADNPSSRPGSAPARRNESPSENGYHLNPQQRSSSLPKSFLTHNSPTGSEMDERIREILSAGMKRGRVEDESGAVRPTIQTRTTNSRSFMRHSWHCTCAHLPTPPETFPPARFTGPNGHSWESVLLCSKITSNNSSLGSSTSRHHRPEDSRRSTPSPNCLHPDIATFPTAPGSPSHGQQQQMSQKNAVERKRTPGLTVTRAQRRIKASSTPALLDRDHESADWSGEDDRITNEDDVSALSRRSREHATEHPLTEATIPLIVSHSRLQDASGLTAATNSDAQTYRVTGNSVQHSQQESVLQKFRKSFSLRFHKKGSKESNEGDTSVAAGLSGSIDDPNNDPPCNSRLNADDENDAGNVNVSELSSQHKEELVTDQKFRFGPLVWRTSKERKKSNKAARNAKCNSGDSGIQIEMVSGGASTGGSGGAALGAGDSSESHDTDVPDETDSPPALRRRVTEKSRPQSELINQILIDKFKADLQQSRASRHSHVRRTNSDLGGQRLLQWDTRSGYGTAHNYRRMLSTPSPIKTRPPRLSPRHSSHDIVTLRSNAKGRASRTNLRRSLSQPLGINQLSPLMRTKTAGARYPGGNVVSEDDQDGRCSGGMGGQGNGTSDDEMMSDSESSVASLTERKKSFEQTMDEELVILAEAVWDHVAIEPEELAFRAGDLIDVLDTMDKDWWWGSCRGEHGWFPAAFVRLRVSQEETVEDCLAAMASGASSTSQSRRRTSISLLSNEQVRSSVVRELVQTERDFVKVLRDVAEGYVAECRRRADMFTEDQIETIFINLEDLLEFQSEFLKDLETRIDWNSPHKSCVAECFLVHRTGFRMYSEYCNSHPMAMATLQELYRHNRYSKFFEACRLMRGLIEIPLDGYLLTPVQRICKYPLQLAELLKYTKTDHPDYNKIREALEAMRAVAVLINERKRRMESLEKLAAWQLRVEGWEGEDLIEVSSQLIYQGDAIRVTTGMWTNNITLFLFDHQLVYCKKDILKRDTYVYKGRIYLDTSEVIDVPDGKDHQLGVTVRHCLKVYSCVRDKWLLFCCRTADEKRKWLNAMAEERRLVEQDRNDGLEFPAAARQLARLAATRQQRCRPPIKPRNKTYKQEPSYEMQAYANQANSTNSLGRKVGTWFTFGSSKKGTRLRPS